VASRRRQAGRRRTRRRAGRSSSRGLLGFRFTISRHGRQRAARDAGAADRLHRALYTDPAIFELELERISAARGWCLATRARCARRATTTRRAWAASPCSCAPGRRPHRRARQPLRAPRLDGVRRRPRQRRTLRVPYHGWSYDRAGALKAVPFASGYAPGKLAELRLHRYRASACIAGSSSPRSRRAANPSRNFSARRAHRSTTSSTAPRGELEVGAACSSTATTATGS